MTAPICAASCSKTAVRPAMSRSSPARSACRRSAKSRTSPTWSETGDSIIVDGGSGEVQLRPPPDVEAAYGEKARLRARRQEQYHKLRDTPTVTRDGVEIALHMNAGLLIDCEHAEEVGAKSIGLFRTELQFMVAPSFPRLSEQFNLYRKVMEAADGRAGDFPHARHRLGQGPALYGQGRGRKSGARLARDPDRARPPRTAADAAARHAARRRRTGNAHHVPDDREHLRIHTGQGGRRARARIPAPPRL